MITASPAACHSGLCCFDLGSARMSAVGWVRRSGGTRASKGSNEPGRIVLLCRIISLRALAAFIAAHLQVERHGAQHRYSLAEHFKRHPDRALQLASEPSASSCEMVRPTLHLKPQGADLHRETPAPDTAAAGLLNKALDAANQAEATIVVLGEENSIVGEGKDRAGLDLSVQQMQLARALKATGKPVAVVLSNGRPLTINWIAANMPAILETWFSGEKGGLAIADILLGNVNPSGKLPMTFPRSVGQIPFYYDHKPTSGHHYVDEADTPLFPFGHGLSYTHFDYGSLEISPFQIPAGGSAHINIHIRNSGATEGTEIVQLYIRDEIGSVTTPEKALKGFARVTLQPGEEKVVTFTVGPEHLSLWNREMHRVVEPGIFKIMAGSSSADIRQTAVLEVMNTNTANH